MPAGRPDIPAHIKREVLTEAGHRCAVCGREAALEFAHIIPWSQVLKHEASNLLLLCAVCHSRADIEKWGQKTLRVYKRQPYVLRQKENRGLITIYFPFATLKNFTPSRVLRVRKRLAQEVGVDVSRIAVAAMDAGSVLITLEVPFGVEEELKIQIENPSSLLAHDLNKIGMQPRPLWKRLFGWLYVDGNKTSSIAAGCFDVLDNYVDPLFHFFIRRFPWILMNGTLVICAGYFLLVRDPTARPPDLAAILFSFACLLSLVTAEIAANLGKGMRTREVGLPKMFFGVGLPALIILWTVLYRTPQPSLTPQETWRNSYFGTTSNTGNAADSADPDGDGFINLLEYAAGTNPKLNGDLFKLQNPQGTGGTFSVSTAGKAGRTYVLERSATMADGSWDTVTTEGPLIADGTVALIDGASPPGTVFYRIRDTGP